MCRLPRDFGTRFGALTRCLSRLGAWVELVRIRSTLHRLHRAVMAEYGHRERIAINDASLARRAARLRAAWDLLQRLHQLEEGFADNPVWGPWVRRLVLSAQRQSKESFLYLALKAPVSVVPFGQLNRFRSLEHCSIIHRHQVGLHPFAYLPDGLSISEALNPPHSRQKCHHHPREERVLILGDQVQVRALTPDGDWTELVAGFGDVVVVSARVHHQLSNPNDHPTADFTVKGPVLQLRIETGLPPGLREGLWILPGHPQPCADATLIVHRLHGLATRLTHDGEDVALDAGQEPATGDTRDIDVMVVSLPPGGTSGVLPCRPVHSGFQAIRVFPWPRPVPLGWDLTTDPQRLRGRVSFLDAGSAVTAQAPFHGGDVVTLAGPVGGHPVTGLRITNDTPDLTLLVGLVAAVNGSPVLSLDHPQALDPARVGGKAAGLAAFAQVARIPPAYVLTADAFRRFMALRGLERLVVALDAASPDWARAEVGRRAGAAGAEDGAGQEARLHDLARTLREAILDAPLPADVTTALGQAYSRLCPPGDDGALCVRSSATTEDRAEASAAGQHDSFLNVRGTQEVGRQVLSCWASLFSERAVAYRNERLFRALGEAPAGYDAVPAGAAAWRHSTAAMGVVVQRLVVPHASGIAFSADPGLGPRLIRVSASYGLGEAIVGGHVTPDAWWVDGDGQMLRGWALGQKTREAVPAPSGGVDWRETEPAARDRFALSDAQVLEVARGVRDIARAFPHRYGVDTEFVIDRGGSLHFVQVRPITKPAPTGHRAIARTPGEPLCGRPVQGRVVSPGATVGRLRVAQSPLEVETGDIVVTFGTSPDWGLALGRAAALVTDVGDDLCHAAIVCRELGIPCIVATGGSTDLLRDWQGLTVTLDTDSRTLYLGALPLADKQDAALPDSDDADTAGSVEETIEAGMAEIRARGRSVIVDGVEWHGRPPHPLPRLQRELYVEAYRRVGLLLDCPFAVLEYQEVVYVRLEDEPRTRRILSGYPPQDWDALMDRRDRAVEDLLGVLADAHAEAGWLERFRECYVTFNQLMALSRDLRTITQIALRPWQVRIPAPDWARLLRAAAREHPSETHAALREYESILLAVRPLASILTDGTAQVAEEALRAAAPALHATLSAYARRFKFPGLRADLRTAPPMAELIAALKRDLIEKRPTIDPEAMDLDEELQRINPEVLPPPQRPPLGEALRRAARAALQMENEHHYKARAHFVLREVLLRVQERLLPPGASIFDLSVAEIVALLRAATPTQESPGGVAVHTTI